MYTELKIDFPKLDWPALHNFWAFLFFGSLVINPKHRLCLTFLLFSLFQHLPFVFWILTEFLTWNAVTCLLRKDCISSARPVTQNVHTVARTDVQDLAERLACGSGSEDSARAVLWRPLYVRPSLLTCAQIYTHTNTFRQSLHNIIQKPTH